MREIIFRGKTSGSKWVYGSFINVKRECNSFCCILESEDSGRYDFPYLDSDLGTIDGQAIPVDFTTIGQHTGLIDKHGNKIFEGDIIIYSDKYKYRVFWSENECAFYIEGIGHLDLDRLGNLYGSSCEIIGNIHDNPELLKGE